MKTNRSRKPGRLLKMPIIPAQAGASQKVPASLTTVLPPAIPSAVPFRVKRLPVRFLKVKESRLRTTLEAPRHVPRTAVLSTA